MEIIIALIISAVASVFTFFLALIILTGGMTAGAVREKEMALVSKWIGFVIGLIIFIDLIDK